MKIHFLPFLLCSSTLLSQLAPVIGPVTVIPQPAYTNSSIRIAVTATTNYQGTSSNLQFYNYGLNMHLKICYSINSTSAVTVHKDTFNLGSLPAGNYTVTLHARVFTGGCYPGLDSTVVKFPMQVLLGTGVAENNLEPISYFPNPAQEKITVNGFAPGFAYRLFSLEGRLITATTARGNQVDLSHLQAGCYFIEIVGPGYLRREKVVKIE